MISTAFSVSGEEKYPCLRLCTCTALCYVPYVVHDHTKQGDAQVPRVLAMLQLIKTAYICSKYRVTAMAAEYLPSSNTTQLLNKPSVRNSVDALFMLSINSQQKAMLRSRIAEGIFMVCPFDLALDGNF